LIGPTAKKREAVLQEDPIKKKKKQYNKKDHEEANNRYQKPTPTKSGVQRNRWCK